MRNLTYIECGLTSGAISEESVQFRNDLRGMVVDTSLMLSPWIGSDIALTAAAGMGLASTIGAGVLGGFAGIVVVPVIARMGLDLMFGVHDALV
jgi:hypothetical protein